MLCICCSVNGIDIVGGIVDGGEYVHLFDCGTQYKLAYVTGYAKTGGYLEGLKFHFKHI